MVQFSKFEIERLDAYFQNNLNDLEKAEIESQVEKCEEFASLFTEMDALYKLGERERRLAAIREIGRELALPGESGSTYTLSFIQSED